MKVGMNKRWNCTWEPLLGNLGNLGNLGSLYLGTFTEQPLLGNLYLGALGIFGGIYLGTLTWESLLGNLGNLCLRTFAWEPLFGNLGNLYLGTLGNRKPCYGWKPQSFCCWGKKEGRVGGRSLHLLNPWVHAWHDPSHPENLPSPARTASRQSPGIFQRNAIFSASFG